MTSHIKLKPPLKFYDTSPSSEPDLQSLAATVEQIVDWASSQTDSW